MADQPNFLVRARRRWREWRDGAAAADPPADAVAAAEPAELADDADAARAMALATVYGQKGSRTEAQHRELCKVMRTSKRLKHLETVAAASEQQEDQDASATVPWEFDAAYSSLR